MPRNARAGSTGTIRKLPLKAVTISWVPGSIFMRRRTSRGMTTWNLGETVTVCISIMLA